MKTLLFLISLFLMTSHNISAFQLSHSQQVLDSAEVLLQQRKAQEAVTLLTPLLNSKNPAVLATSHRITGQAHIQLRDYEQAGLELQQALRISEKIFNQREQSNALYYLGRVNALSGNFEKAIILAEKAAHVASMIQDPSLEFRINNLLSWAFFSTDTDFYKILDHEKRQFEIVNLIGSNAQKAFIFNNLGYDLTVAGTVPIDSTIALMTFANNTYAELENSEGRWYTLMNLTWQHRLKKDFEKSIEFGKKSLNEALDQQDRHAIVEAAFQLGETYLAIGNIEEAAPYYETGLEWRGQESDRDSYVFDVYYARYLWEKGEKETAIALLEKAVEFLSTSEVFYEMHGRALMASYYFEDQNYEQAEKQLSIIEHPRHNYISLETRCLAAITRAKLFRRNNLPNYANELINSWAIHTKNIGARQLSELLNSSS